MVIAEVLENSSKPWGHEDILLDSARKSLQFSLH